MKRRIWEFLKRKENAIIEVSLWVLMLWGAAGFVWCAVYLLKAWFKRFLKPFEKDFKRL